MAENKPNKTSPQFLGRPDDPDAREGHPDADLRRAGLRLRHLLRQPHHRRSNRTHDRRLLRRPGTIIYLRLMNNQSQSCMTLSRGT